MVYSFHHQFITFLKVDKKLFPHLVKFSNVMLYS